MLTPAFVVLLVVLFALGVAAMVFFKPAGSMLMKVLENQRAGLFEDPAYQREMRRLNTRRWLIIASQVILFGLALALVSQGSVIAWVVWIILFGIAFVARTENEAARLRLMTDGVKRD